MHPRTPILSDLFFFFKKLILDSFFLIVCSAFSLIEQVFSKIRLEFSILSVCLYPIFSNMDATTSESAKFIWQP